MPFICADFIRIKLSLKKALHNHAYQQQRLMKTAMARILT